VSVQRHQEMRCGWMEGMMLQVFMFAVYELSVRRADVRNGGGRGTRSGFSAALRRGLLAVDLSFWVRGCANGRR